MRGLLEKMLGALTDAELRELRIFIDVALFNRALDAETIRFRSDHWGVH